MARKQPAAPDAAPVDPAQPDTGAPPAPPELVLARVLVDGAAGRCNDVVELEAQAAAQLERDGAVDTNEAAVAFALTLPQNQRA